jgi:hypothetical protein
MLSDRKKLESSATAASIERRKHPRYPFSATAEVVEMRSGARIQGRVSDLGRGGCYVDSISPFGVNAEVKIRIVNQNKAFVAQARVVFAAAGMGMGLAFSTIDPDQLPILKGWLAELSGDIQPDTAVLEQESQKVTTENAASQEQSYVLNELIIALMRENVLSDLEGNTAEATAMMPMVGEKEYDARHR